MRTGEVEAIWRNFGRRSVCVRTKGILSRICRLYSVIGWFRTLEKIDGYGKIISEMKSN